jgi:hypothetical protein
MSEFLISQYQLLHANKAYGNTSVRYAPYILPHIQSLNPKTILDFGCGQSRLFEIVEWAGTRVTRYDPAIPELSKIPSERHDLVLNIDVMEHLPEEEIDDILSQIAGLGDHAIFIIDTIPAKNHLPNGQNCHLTIQPAPWWQNRLRRYFEHVEPIYAKPTWRAAFKTWPTKPFGSTLIRMGTLKYRALKFLKHPMLRPANRKPA